MLMALFLIGIGVALAQTQVQSTIVDEQGEPVIGASVLVKGTTTGTVTNIDGEFALSAPANGMLVILMWACRRWKLLSVPVFE